MLLQWRPRTEGSGRSAYEGAHMASEITRNEPFLPDRELHPAGIPEGVDRRAFMMRSALIGATAVITGCSPATPQQQAALPPPAAPPVPASTTRVVQRHKIANNRKKSKNMGQAVRILGLNLK